MTRCCAIWKDKEMAAHTLQVPRVLAVPARQARYIEQPMRSVSLDLLLAPLLHVPSEC
jgi:hypothetical protein